MKWPLNSRMHCKPQHKPAAKRRGLDSLGACSRRRHVAPEVASASAVLESTPGQLICVAGGNETALFATSTGDDCTVSQVASRDRAAGSPPVDNNAVSQPVARGHQAQVPEAPRLQAHHSR